MATTDSATTDNVFALQLDTQTAIRKYLNNRYGTNNDDIAPLLARWQQEFTAQDSTRHWMDLLKTKIHGKETS